MEFILGHGFFFWPIISFTVCGYISLYQARWIAGRRFQALVMNLCGLTMCAYSTYAVSIEPRWVLLLFQLVLIFQSALICVTPVRQFKDSK